MINFVLSKWRGGTPDERYFVLDIRYADRGDVKMVCEAATDGLARLLCALLNKNEDERNPEPGGVETAKVISQKPHEGE